MSRNTVADHDQTHSAQGLRTLPALLLVAVGLSLIGAGALLWSRHGDTVLVGNPVLAVLAWCL